MNPPIKRTPELQPLSRDHHQGLLLCWKIRKGISNGTPSERIKEYVKWFYSEHLLPHFKTEEDLLFTILGSAHPLIIQAITEHRDLEKLITDESNSQELLQEIAQKLDDHIRFEERTLFGEIEKVATAEQLQLISTHHQEPVFCDNDTLKFW